MKYLLSLILLGLCPYSYGLFHCWRKADEHVRLKEKESQPTTLLDSGTNSSKPLTIRLAHPDDFHDRFFMREVSATDTKKRSGDWKLTIVNNPGGCLELSEKKIVQQKNSHDPVISKWLMHPQKPGIALLEATYTDTQRKEPYRQNILVTIE